MLTAPGGRAAFLVRARGCVEQTDRPDTASRAVSSSSAALDTSIRPLPGSTP